MSLRIGVELFLSAQGGWIFFDCAKVEGGGCIFPTLYSIKWALPNSTNVINKIPIIL